MQKTSTQVQRMEVSLKATTSSLSEEKGSDEAMQAHMIWVWWRYNQHHIAYLFGNSTSPYINNSARHPKCVLWEMSLWKNLHGACTTLLGELTCRQLEFFPVIMSLCKLTRGDYPQKPNAEATMYLSPDNSEQSWVSLFCEPLQVALRSAPSKSFHDLPATSVFSDGIFSYST